MKNKIKNKIKNKVKNKVKMIDLLEGIQGLEGLEYEEQDQRLSMDSIINKFTLKLSKIGKKIESI